MMTRVNGFADVRCFPCGSNTLIALGDTMVEVIMKNISNKNMMSVMDAILKLGDILFLLFNAIRDYFCWSGSFNKSINAMVRASIWLTTLSTRVTK